METLDLGSWGWRKGPGPGDHVPPCPLLQEEGGRCLRGVAFSTKPKEGIGAVMEEWGVLQERRKELYRDIMQENYGDVLSLGFPIVKPNMISWMEQREEPLDPNQDLDPGSEERTSTRDAHTDEATSSENEEWEEEEEEEEEVHSAPEGPDAEDTSVVAPPVLDWEEACKAAKERKPMFGRGAADELG
uniref:Uncharacterized protein n=1 Tax=Sphaerodactylus townsendi TaxID=933632 RepID=A0ACB8EX35_9SAUR